MSAIVELVKFTASGDLPAALLPVLKSAGNADGHLKVFHGVTVEDKAVGYIVLLWDSKDAFTHWPARAEFEEKSKFILSQSSTLQIQLEFLVAEVFEAPVTEFALAKLKDEANRDEYNSTADSLAKMMSSKGKGGYAPAFGPVVKGKEADVVIIIGWDSPEAHANAVKDEPGVGKLFELAHLKVIHVPFTKLL